MPIPPRPAPNHASAVANEGTERTPPTSAAIGLSATTAIHIAPNDTPRITSDSDAVTQEVRVSMDGIMRAGCSTFRRKSERLLEARRIARPDLRVEHARGPLAVERGDHLLSRKASHVL